MAKAKKRLTTRARVDKPNAAIMRLYKAAASYVKSRGGEVVIANGIEVQKWPDDSKGHFRVAVRCFGTNPSLPKNDT